MPHPDKDALTWRLLEHVPQWSSEVVDRCCRILSRTDADAWGVNALASIVSATLPDEAPRLLKAWLGRRLRCPGALPTFAESSPRDDAGADELAQAVRRRSESQEPYQAFFTNHSLQDAPAIAEAAPRPFLDAVWPALLNITERLASEPHPFVVGYRTDPTLLMQKTDRDTWPEAPLFEGVMAAIQRLASDEPTAFLTFVENNRRYDLLLVQRLLAHGMSQLVTRHPDEVLTFLVEDPRRLALGPLSSQHADSQQLIGMLVPHLSEAGRRRLQTALRDWSHYSRAPDDTPEVRLRRVRWNREHRLRLLRAFPWEHMTPDCRKLVAAETRAFPDLMEAGIRFSGLRDIGSPMSAEQMARAKPEDIIHLFEEITDDRHWDHPHDWGRGGSIQAGRALGEMAAREPEKAIGITRMLQPGRNEIPVAYVLEGLVKAGVSSKVLYDLILEFAQQGFAGQDFRSAAAKAVERLVSVENPLPDAILDLFEGWLTSADVEATEERMEDDGREDSILWGYGRTRLLPHGNFPMLSALSRSCFIADPPRVARWLAILERHLDRAEDPGVWAAMGHYSVSLI